MGWIRKHGQIRETKGDIGKVSKMNWEGKPKRVKKSGSSSPNGPNGIGHFLTTPWKE